ncbi:MAG TPA: L-arabinose isomerase [Streptosporangiaceae bacterium]|jgi:L-arabinose isomerase|nr:L-arabinose isomerase [Streptosporangiaceae bacterium]
MSAPSARAEVWFITGSVDMYGDDSLRQVAEHSAAIVATLNESSDIPVQIIAKPVVAGRDAIRRIMLDANSADDCIGVIAWMHTFSPAKMWIGGLTALQRPLLHLHTQFNQKLPWSEIDMDFMNLNQSAHGDREFAFIESRMRIARTTVVGHWSDPAVQRRIGLWSRAACGRAEAQRLRIARFGDNMRYVAVTEGDKVEAEMQLGFSVNTYGVSDLTDAVAQVGDSEASRLAQQYQEEYEVAAELRSGGERHDSLREAGRIEIALRSLLSAGGFGAFTDNFEDLGLLRQLPGISAQRLMADGYGFGAEGDWKSAALLRIVKVMTAGLAGGVSFMEDYTYDLDPGRGLILGAHMLELCPSIAAATPRCEIAPLSLGQREDPVRLVFNAAAGPAIVANWLDLGNRFRLVLNKIDIVTPPEDLPRLPVARAIWRPRPDLASSAEAWMMAGGPHHTVLSTSATSDLLRMFAAMCDIEFLQIDERTQLDAFENEIRWNSVYYHLSRKI